MYSGLTLNLQILYGIRISSEHLGDFVVGIADCAKVYCVSSFLIETIFNKEFGT